MAAGDRTLAQTGRHVMTLRDVIGRTPHPPPPRSLCQPRPWATKDVGILPQTAVSILGLLEPRPPAGRFLSTWHSWSPVRPSINRKTHGLRQPQRSSPGWGPKPQTLFVTALGAGVQGRGISAGPGESPLLAVCSGGGRERETTGRGSGGGVTRVPVPSRPALTSSYPEAPEARRPGPLTAAEWGGRTFSGRGRPRVVACSGYGAATDTGAGPLASN